MPNQLMTPFQAAVVLGLGERHVRAQISDERIRGQRIDGRIMVEPIVIADRFKLELDSSTVQATTLKRLRDRATRVGYTLDEPELIETARALLRQAYHLEPSDAASHPIQGDHA